MPLQWKKTTLYPYLTCSRIHVEACTRRLAPLFGDLSDVPVRLLSAVLSSQLGPVQLQRLLSEVLPLRVGLVRAAGAVAVAAAAAAELSPLECLLQWLSRIPVAPCWHLSRKPVVPRREAGPSMRCRMPFHEPVEASACAASLDSGAGTASHPPANSDW